MVFDMVVNRLFKPLGNQVRNSLVAVLTNVAKVHFPIGHSVEILDQVKKRWFQWSFRLEI